MTAQDEPDERTGGRPAEQPSDQLQMSLEELESHIARAETLHRDLQQRLDATGRR